MLADLDQAQSLRSDSAETRKAATAGYQAARAMGCEVAPQVLANLATGITNDLSAAGPTPRSAKGTFEALDAATGAPQGGRVTGANIMNLRRELGMLAQEVQGCLPEHIECSRSNKSQAGGLDIWLE